MTSFLASGRPKKLGSPWVFANLKINKMYNVWKFALFSAIFEKSHFQWRFTPKDNVTGEIRWQLFLRRRLKIKDVWLFFWNYFCNIKNQTPIIRLLKLPFLVFFHCFLEIEDPWQNATVVINSVYNLEHSPPKKNRIPANPRNKFVRKPRLLE